MAYWLEARIVEPAQMAVAGEQLCKQMPVARQWLGDHHVVAAKVAHATTAELFEAVFSVQSMPRLYNMGQLPYQLVLSWR
jgi:hypothetical protein